MRKVVEFYRVMWCLFAGYSFCGDEVLLWMSDFYLFAIIMQRDWKNHS